MHFIGWEILFGKNIAEFYFWGSNCKQVSTGPGNGLAPNRQQAIIWTNAERVLWHHKASKGHNDLKIWIISPRDQWVNHKCRSFPYLSSEFCLWLNSLITSLLMLILDFLHFRLQQGLGLQQKQRRSYWHLSARLQYLHGMRRLSARLR